MPALLPLFNHSCLWTSHWIRVEKFCTTFRTNGVKVQDLWLVITCAFLSQREREKWNELWLQHYRQKSTRGNFILIQIWKERLLLLRKAVSQCFRMFFTTSEISVILLVVVSLTVWLVFFLSLSLFFLFFWLLRHIVYLVWWCYFVIVTSFTALNTKKGNNERSPLKIKIYLGNMEWNHSIFSSFSTSVSIVSYVRCFCL